MLLAAAMMIILEVGQPALAATSARDAPVLVTCDGDLPPGFDACRAFADLVKQQLDRDVETGSLAEARNGDSVIKLLINRISDTMIEGQISWTNSFGSAFSAPVTMRSTMLDGGSGQVNFNNLFATLVAQSGMMLHH